MDDKSRYTRLLVGIIVFGSVWGLVECIVGDFLTESSLPSGAIMTGFFGFGLMIMTRILYQQRGMQIGMGIMAGALKFLHPIGGCMLCSAIAIAAEGAFFEIIWISPRLHPNKLSASVTVSMGIISGFIIYSAGYVATQILTPIASNAIFSLAGLPAIIPSILSSATLAGLIGGVTLTVITVVPSHISKKLIETRKEIYFPTAFAIAVLCWVGILLL